MKDKIPTLQECAMRHGTLMGLFWAFKFVLFPIGLTIPILQIVFVILTLFVPILGYFFTKKYRITYSHGIISFAQAFFFCFLMYCFASLLVAIVHYIYFQFIDNGFVFNEYISMISQMKSALKEKDMVQTFNQFEDAVKTLSALRPIELTLQLITQNIFYGILMAIPTAALVMRKKINY